MSIDGTGGALTVQEIDSLISMRKMHRKKVHQQPLESLPADLATMKRQKELIQRLEKSLRTQKIGFQHEIHGV